MFSSSDASLYTEINNVWNFRIMPYEGTISLVLTSTLANTDNIIIHLREVVCNLAKKEWINKAYYWHQAKNSVYWPWWVKSQNKIILTEKNKRTISSRIWFDADFWSSLDICSWCSVVVGEFQPNWIQMKEVLMLSSTSRTIFIITHHEVMWVDMMNQDNQDKHRFISKSNKYRLLHEHVPMKCMFVMISTFVEWNNLAAGIIY